MCEKTEDNSTEIEITEEMISAGRMELLSFNHDYEDERDAVVRIYTAMNLALTRKRD